ncbi:MAG: hypothetical protein JW924_12305 [Fusobacteriaceae bacterium]|nr:hypothetical protein [Fusobacteriaceae bacterium]
MINKSKNTEEFKEKIKDLNLNAYTNRCYYFLFQKVMYICAHEKLKEISLKYNMYGKEEGSHERKIGLVLAYMNERRIPTDKVESFKKIERLKDFRKKADYKPENIESFDIKKIDKIVSKVDVELETIINDLDNQ